MQTLGSTRGVWRHCVACLLETEQKEEVEMHLVGCPCGGKLSFKNALKCPVCGGVFSEPMAFSKSEVVIVIDCHIDGNNTRVWREM